MASAARFTLYPCSLVHAGGTLNLQQMQNFAVTPEAKITRIQPAGAIDQAANVMAMADPMIRFATRDLTTAFGVFSASVGVALASGGATFRLQEREDLSTFSTGTTHETFTVTQGLVIPTQLSATQDDENGASLGCMLYPTWDGTNNPIVHNTGVDFSAAPAPAFTSQFWLGPVYINGSEVPGIISSSVDFGISVATKRTSGGYYAVTAVITSRRPVIKFTTVKVDTVSAVDKFLRALAGTIAVYYWKGSSNSSRVATATTSHCKISATAGGLTEDSITAEENDDGTVEVSIFPTSALSVSVASAIGG